MHQAPRVTRYTSIFTRYALRGSLFFDSPVLFCPQPGCGALSAIATFGANNTMEAAAVKAAYIPAFLRASFLDIFLAVFSVVVFIIF